MDASTSHEYLADDRTVVVTLHKNVGLSNCKGLEALSRRLADEIREGTTRNVIVDCQRTDALGATALGQFLRLWKVATRGGGQFVLCGLSPLERETILVFQLDRLWTIYPSRRQAVEAIATGAEHKATCAAASGTDAAHA